MANPTSSGSKGCALVTGGSARIGRAISSALAQAGYNVACHVRHPSLEAEAFVRELEKSGVRAGLVAAELADPETPARLIRDAHVLVGPITVLVNNASEFESDDIATLDPQLWDRHFAVNLRAPIFLAQAFADQFPRDAKGCIVNITDQRARKRVPRQFSYTLTKCALDAATVMLAQALAPRIRVNAVAPGPTLPSPRQDNAAFAKQAAMLPLGAGPNPDDIAAAVAYLVTADRVTGETIAVDGGQHISWRTPDVTEVEE
jgi:NAD(P)-dependent dehydrogenase (short-subunit alcohol dehydrogenase family)